MKLKNNITHDQKTADIMPFFRHYLIMSILLLLSVALICHAASAAELHVGPAQTYSTIQSAVDAASSGDNIIVHAGNYTENVDINKMLTLQGEGMDVVTVTALDSSDHIFEVNADWVSISGFTVTGASEGWKISGIYLVNDVDHCRISDNNVSDNYYGIRLHESCDNTLINNTVNSNTWNGIVLSYSSNNTLTNNILNSNRFDGINLGRSNKNILMNNTFTKNGLLVSFSYENTVIENTVNDKPLVYYEDTSDITIKDAGQVILVRCSNITVKDLDISYLSSSIQLRDSNDCKILNNNISNNNCGIGGISLIYSNNNVLTNNIASDNNCGISLEGSCENTLSNNSVNSNHNKGIWLWCSDSNILINNIVNFNNNGIELVSSCNNNTLTNNIFNSNNNNGIMLDHSGNNILSNNTIFKNRYNLAISGISHSHYIQNINTSNKVNGKPIYYWVDKHNQVVPNDAGYVGIIDSSNITVQNLTITNNYNGILFVYTINSKIVNVNVSNNYNGFFLIHSNNNDIYNNYLDNINNAYDNGKNFWNVTKTAGTNIYGGPYLGGNFWSDYEGSDSDGDGLGDTLTPYNLLGKIEYGGDYHPLV